MISLLAVAAVGCAKAKKDDPQSTDGSPDKVYADVVARLPHFIPDGFVVSIDAGGQPRNQGDSLIWSGIAMAALSCDEGRPVADALRGMLLDNGGSMYRHPTLKGEISLDGALGIWRGVAERVRHCGQAEADAWKPALALSQGIAPSLNVAAGHDLEPYFQVVRDAVFRQVGLDATPSDTQQALLEAEVAGWAAADLAGKGSCYRVHLGLQTLQTLEAAGRKISANGRNLFCDATKKADLPTTDHWCGRGDLGAWLAAFKENTWQFRHQRCPAWETPDGQGMEQPGVDALIAYRDLMTGEE